ncbi:hypothetical protein ABKV19_010412 [Rosa sericea]
MLILGLFASAKSKPPIHSITSKRHCFPLRRLLAETRVTEIGKWVIWEEYFGALRNSKFVAFLGISTSGICRFGRWLGTSDFRRSQVADEHVKRLCDEAIIGVENARWFDLVSLMLTSVDVILSKVSDKDFDLFNLYYLLEDPYSRFSVYLSALNLAINGKVTEHVLPSFKQMDSFLKEWNIGASDQRQLFLTISNVIKEHKSLAKESFKFLTKYLATFSGEDAHVLSQAKDEAVHTIVEFVKTPDMFQCDLLDMPAVVQLEKDAKHALAYQLLKIFLTQRLDAYLEFQAANSTMLQSYGLVHEDCITKMRLISLVDLGSDESGRIPYSLIRDTLQINEDEVEPWVVKAITAKLLDCKMDQMNEVVVVTRSTQRVFGKEQWHTLKTKLASWRVNSILEDRTTK